MDDEWLTQIYESLRDAKDILIQFAEDHPFDSDMENQVTRYFGKRQNPFIRRKELLKDDPDIVEKEWMRYAVYEII